MVESLLLETIRVENGKYQNLSFHQWRVDWSREKLGFTNRLLLNLPTPPKNGIFRTRLLYSKEIDEIQFIPYQKKIPKTFSLVFSDEVKYDLKYQNRETLQKLKNSKNSDEVIIVKNELITDTSIANIYFWDFQLSTWITPKQPLLQGTFRQKLLHEKKVFEKNIHFNEIKKFKQIALSNAMTGFLTLNHDDFTIL
jgi:4-amino-4-deoxychorismate lyase